MFRMYDKDMESIEFPDGVTPLDIFISSISKDRKTESLEGMNGKIDYGAVYSDRDIKLVMRMESYDTQDYRLLRNELFSVLDGVYYVSEDYDPGKVYPIRIDSRYIPDRIEGNQTIAELKVECSTPGLPFSKSIKTTLDIDKNGVEYGNGWYYGMGLINNSESWKYKHNSTEFRIYNAGDVAIHPFEEDLHIVLKGISGKGFKMENVTTGDKFVINDSMSRSDTFVIYGANMTLNASQALRKTNRGFISLDPGWNDIRLNKKAQTEWRFRFYYV